MITTFVIPIIDIDSNKFEFNGNLSAESYSEMLMDDFKSNYKAVNDFMKNGKAKSNDVSVTNGAEVEDKFVFKKTEASLTDDTFNSVDIDFLEKYVQSGKKFILRVNINPSSIDEDGIVEMNYLMKDSEMVLSDTRLDNKTKILSLPLKDYLIDTGEKTYKISDCKIIELTVKPNAPYSFALLVDKITYL